MGMFSTYLLLPLTLLLLGSAVWANPIRPDTRDTCLGQFPGDADRRGIVNVSDAVFLIAHIFGGGPIPCDCCIWMSRLGAPLR
jgi:hypothetical protein